MLRRSPSSSLVRFGTATLVAGTLAGIDAGCLTAPDQCTILLSRNTPSGTLGFLTAPVSARGAAATTFTITSTDAADTSTVNWMAIPKNRGLGSSSEYVNTASLRRPPSGKFVARGKATLVAGTVTVTGVSMSAGALVFVMANTPAGTPGKLSAPAASVDASAGSFVINSDSALDTSTVDWVVIDQAPRFSPSGNRFAQAEAPMSSGSVTLNDMNPMNQEVSVLASVITSSNPGNLSAPDASRTGGGYAINSTGGTDGSRLETAAF